MSHRRTRDDEAIAFPGAAYISISFDDDTRLSDGDWVKFYKDDTRIECWSDKSAPPITEFSQSLPGQFGKLPLVVGADRLIVHFHTDKHKRRPKTYYTITLEVIRTSFNDH